MLKLIGRLIVSIFLGSSGIAVLTVTAERILANEILVGKEEGQFSLARAAGGMVVIAICVGVLFAIALFIGWCVQRAVNSRRGHPRPKFWPEFRMMSAIMTAACLPMIAIGSSNLLRGVFLNCPVFVIFAIGMMIVLLGVFVGRGLLGRLVLAVREVAQKRNESTA